MFRSIWASRFKERLTYWERFVKVFTFRHPTEFVGWGDLPVDVRRMICRVEDIVEEDGIDTSNIDICFTNNDYIGTAYLKDNLITLDRHFLNPDYAIPMMFTLFHEIRHFDQYRRGHIWVMSKKVTYWMGDYYQTSSGDEHFIEPWELDANAYAESKLTDEQLPLDFSLYHKIKKEVAKHNVDMVMQY